MSPKRPRPEPEPAAPSSGAAPDDTLVLPTRRSRAADPSDPVDGSTGAAVGDGGDAPPKSRAGRNLPAAIGVGVALGAVVIGSLVWRRELFVVVLAAAVLIGAWELRRAFGTAGLRIPLLPLLLGALSMVTTAYVKGAESLVVTLGITVLVLLTWRVADGLAGAARDVAGSVFIALYPCFLGGFAALLVAPDDGHRRVLVFLITTVFSDIGGYAVGVLAGKHPMAPSLSPKKSWEGFAGSVVACAVAGALSIVLILHGTWWQGALLGVVLAVAATAGDLVESSIKRDLGVKDMGSILPGHGGLMDRLDSLVIALPFAWFLLAVMVPVG